MQVGRVYGFHEVTDDGVKTMGPRTQNSWKGRVEPRCGVKPGPKVEHACPNMAVTEAKNYHRHLTPRILERFMRVHGHTAWVP